MSIRFKAVSIIFFAFIGFILSLFFINKNLMSNKVDSYESAQVLRESTHLKKIIHDDIKSLNIFTEHLSSQEIFKGNLAQEKVKNKLIELTQLDNIDFILLTDASGTSYTQYLKGKILSSHPNIGLIFNEKLSQTPFVLHYIPGLGNNFISGIYLTKVGNALVSAVSFLDDNNKPLILIAGQLIDKYYISKIEQATKYKLSVLNPKDHSEKFNEIAKRVQSARLTNLVETSENSVTVSSIFPDIYGNSATIIDLQINREIKENIQKILIQSIKYTSIFAFTLLLVIIAFLHTQIIVPLRTISRQMVAFRQTQNLPINPYTGRQDEIGCLSREFINLVEDVGFFRRTLAETTYDVSIIAITQNIFHYLGKNFSKNLESLNKIQSELHEIPQDKLLSLQKKLSSKSSSPEEKQQATLNFIGHSLKIATIPSSIAEKIEHITSIMERVLVSTNRDLFAERPLLKSEIIKLEQILDHAYDSLPAITRDNITFNTDLEIKEFKAPTLNRITLQFVIQEAIENSAQAIHRGNNDDGLIKVSSQYSNQDMKQLVIIEIKDNGVGFSEEALDNIFTEKHSHKNQIGPGLNWCKTALNTMGGDLEIINSKETHSRGSVIQITVPILEDNLV